jgi:hypothetical protein
VTQRRRCDDYDRLHARVCDHRAVIVVDWNFRPRRQPSTAPAADGGKSDSGKIVQQMLHISAAMTADTDEADSDVCWQLGQHQE